MLSFAGGGANTRDTQLFIAFSDLDFLGKSAWETPIGIVTSGMETVVDKFYQGYGDQRPYNDKGKDYGVDQGRIFEEGNAYLRRDFPLLSYIQDCWLADGPGADGGGGVEAGAVAGGAGAGAGVIAGWNAAAAGAGIGVRGGKGDGGAGGEGAAELQLRAEELVAGTDGRRVNLAERSADR
ncbi:unnamed protein product [Phaeothamnion confervicola]